MDKELLLDALSAFLMNTSDLMFIKNPSLIYVAASTQFAQLVNVPRDEIIGKNDYDLFSKELADRYTGDDKRILASGMPVEDYVEPIPEKDGRRRFTSTSKYVIRDKEGEIIGLYGIGHDITEMLELESQARAADAAKSDFLARMSHDMRTPMNGIIGLINLTLSEELSETVRDNLVKMENSGKYLLRLINDTLDVNKIERNQLTLNMESTNIRELLDAVLASIKPIIDEKRVNFTFSNCVRTVPVVTDKVRLQQILINILANAVKFTDEGGHVAFKMERLNEDEASVTDRFTVEDDGIGMNEKFIPHIFEPFSQESGQQVCNEGAGLGMSIVNKLVSLMGGTVLIASKKGEGTKVTVTLRFERAKLKPTPERVEGTEFKALDGVRILLCEDHPLNAEIAVRLLRARGCTVDCVENGKLGLDAFASSKPGYYDAVLMDIRMPVMNGLEAASAIRALDRDDAKKTVIVAMTANAFVEDVQKSKDAGMDGHLAKPIEPRLLFETLDTLIGAKRA